MAATSRKELMDLIRSLERQGWKIRRNKHVTAYPPDRQFPPVTFAVSSGGGRGFKNAIALLKKCGAKDI